MAFLVADDTPDKAIAQSRGDVTPRLLELAEEVRQSGILGKAALMNRLFDFLVERSQQGFATKEIELAQAVFSQGGNADLLQDASVRVSIHRLRRKLDAYYSTGEFTHRLIIPKGTYQLTVVKTSTATALEPGKDANRQHAHPQTNVLAMIGAGLLLLGTAGGAYWGRTSAHPARLPATDTQLWNFLQKNGRPTFIVVGDQYAYGVEARDGQWRLVMDPAINSSAEIDKFKLGHSADAKNYANTGAQFLPASSAFAMRTLLPLIDAGGSTARPARVMLLSDLSPDVMKGANIIYIGTIDRLGKLGDLVFRYSRFRVRNYGAFRLSAALKPIRASASNSIGREYAYISTFSGPSGSRFVIVAGTGNASAKQAAETAADPAQIGRMRYAAKGSENFEALWQVNAIRNVSYGTTLLGAFPLAGAD